MQIKSADYKERRKNTELKFHTIKDYETYSGKYYEKLELSYQVFGKTIGSAPLVLVNHALTGNSDIMSQEKGWWKNLAGPNKLIDTNKYSIVSFNILGNGYDGLLIKEYKDFIAKDIARLQHQVLSSLGIHKIHAAIGGSLGGCLTWELAALQPEFIKYIIPIAADWKSTDWIIGHNSVQESILLNSKNPLQDARKMAMLFYRTPKSLSNKFARSQDPNGEKNVSSWLNHHGKKLETRFELKAYLMMNHLLSTVDAFALSKNINQPIKTNSKIIQITIDTDMFFVPDENLKTKIFLDKFNIKNEHHIIHSIHGHDAFLIEDEQITKYLRPIFQVNKNSKIAQSKYYGNKRKCG